jgi:chromosome partitioning protein
MGRVVAVTNLKGGIGKTTTVVNVGAGLALKGARVLLVDVDAQGNLAMALGVRPRHTLYEVIVDGKTAASCITQARPGLDLLPADESLLGAQPDIARRADWSYVLEQALRPLVRAYDFIFVDCGGSLTVLNINALMAASDLLVPTAVEHLSVSGLALLYKQVERLKGSTACVRTIVPTMFDPRLRQAHELLQQLHDTYGSVVAPPIRVNVRLSEAPSQGRTIYEYDPRSRGAADYAQLVERLSAQLNFAPQTNGAAPATNSAAPAAKRAASSQAPQRNTPSPASPPPAPAPIATPAERAPSAAPAEVPLVTGGGSALQLSCPYCGRPLQRATVAGYRVAYCDHCKYRRQDLAAGVRR